MKKQLVRITSDGNIFYAVRRKRLFCEWEYKDQHTTKWIKRSVVIKSRTTTDAMFFSYCGNPFYTTLKGAMFAYFNLPKKKGTKEVVIG